MEGMVIGADQASSLVAVAAAMDITTIVEETLFAMTPTSNRLR
jgi:hypothetical protein